MNALATWRDNRDQAVTARTSGPLIHRAERLPGSIDLADLERLNADLATASLAEMAAEHDDLNRWLNVPHAEEWADQHREKSARLKALWQAIGRRFPQYVAKRGFRRTV